MRALEAGRKAALVTVECQNSQTNPVSGGPANHAALAEASRQREIIAHIAALAAACRELGLPVIHNRVVHRPDWLGTGVNSRLLGANRKHHKLIVGTPDVELNPGLGIAETDFVIDRLTGLTPFHGTSLDQTLRNCRIDTIIVCGVSTNLGIPGAVIEAVNHGYWVVVAEDCTAGTSPEAHQYMMTSLIPILADIAPSTEIAAELRDKASA